MKPHRHVWKRFGMLSQCAECKATQWEECFSIAWAVRTVNWAVRTRAGKNWGKERKA
jgi:hypothetical protein